jgi:hypothetical protein
MWIRSKNLFDCRSSVRYADSNTLTPSKQDNLVPGGLKVDDSLRIRILKTYQEILVFGAPQARLAPPPNVREKTAQAPLYIGG